MRALVVAPWGTDTGKAREIGPEMGGKKLISRRRVGCEPASSAPVPMGATPAAGGLIPGNRGRRAGELGPSPMELLQVRVAATVGPCRAEPLCEE